MRRKFLILVLFSRALYVLWRDEKNSEYKEKSQKLKEEIKAMEDEYLNS